jgi:uncharacterized protein (DUF362 family)
MNARVAVTQSAGLYLEEAPFHPSEKYPEYPFGENLSSAPNTVYAALRELFVQLEYDKENFGKANWNPLKDLISPGMTVVLKPNFVRSWHAERKDPYSMITHPSVLRAIADYCLIALQGKGKIIIADAPQYDGNWSELVELTKIDEIEDFFEANSSVEFESRDLRPYWSRKRHFPSMVEPLKGDLQGSVRVNLETESALISHKRPEKLYGAVYHRQETVQNHTGNKQVYEVSRTVMEADVVICVPKLKTHKKVGVTMNIKGLVGICTNKNLIVHYTLGLPSEGGDQYPPNHFTPIEERLIKTERWMYDTFLAKQSVPLEYIHRSIYWMHGKFIKPFGIGVDKKKRLLDVGNWYGNDSAWRMSVDLLKLFLFADKNGKLHKTQQRKVFSIIDGIIGGENKGPLEPDPVESKILIASENMLAADIVGTRLMGFDPLKIKMFTSLMNEASWNFGVKEFSDIEVKSADKNFENCLLESENRFFNYAPYPGWVGHIEI